MQKNTGLIYYNDIFQKYGGYFDMFDINKDGVIKKLNRDSVDCDECW